MKSVSIIIPNWNGRELLAEFFPSVVAAAEHYRTQFDANVEIIVIDDASTDDGVVWLLENYGNGGSIRIVANEQNLGFLLTVNKAFENAKGDVVFLLNSDVQAARDCIEPLTKHFDDPAVFAVCCHAGRINSDRLDGGGKIGRFERGFWRVFLNYEAIPEEATSELISFYGSGGYTMYDRQKWSALGGFQEILSPNYWEDVEICYRAWKRGWKVIYEPTSHVKHKGSATMGKQPVRAQLGIVTERNRLLMMWINLHDGKLLVSHLGWLAAKLLASAVTIKWNYLRSFAGALRLISKVRTARRIERKHVLLTDVELSKQFVEIVKQPGIFVVASEADEAAFIRIRDSR